MERIMERYVDVRVFSRRLMLGRWHFIWRRSTDGDPYMYPDHRVVFSLGRFLVTTDVF